MSFDELFIVGGALCGLAALRFGVPLAVVWVVGKAANFLTHAS